VIKKGNVWYSIYLFILIFIKYTSAWNPWNYGNGIESPPKKIIFVNSNRKLQWTQNTTNHHPVFIKRRNITPIPTINSHLHLVQINLYETLTWTKYLQIKKNKFFYSRKSIMFSFVMKLIIYDIFVIKYKENMISKYN